MAGITQKDIKEINRLRKLFPKSLDVKIERSEDGGFVAEVKTFPGCFTQGDSFSELIEMVNDAVRTYFEVPRVYLSYVPNYVPPLPIAQLFNVFPVVTRKKNVKFEIPDDAVAAC